MTRAHSKTIRKSLLTLLFVLASPIYSQTESPFPNVALHNRLELSQDQALGIRVWTSDVSAPIPSSIERMVVAGMANGKNWTLQIRSQDEAGLWSDWSPLELHWHPQGRFWARWMLTASLHRQSIQLRVMGQGNELPAEIVFNSINLIESAEEEPLQREQVRTLSLADTVPAPPLVTRTQWGARPSNGVLSPHVLRRGAIHHTALRRIGTLEDGILEMRFMQDLHINGNGWKDIGYHYCIDDSGRVYEGTPVDFVGSHVSEGNTGNVGISFMGVFGAVRPTEKAGEACSQLLAHLAGGYPITIDSVLGHRDYNPNTTCPGDSAYAALPDLRSRVRQKLSSGSPYVLNPLPRPFSREIEPNSAVSFSLRDDIEGIRAESLLVRVNGEAVLPTVQLSGPNEIFVSYTPAGPFPFSSVVSVDVTAQDSSAQVMHYHYEFTIKAQTIFTEMMDVSHASNSETMIAGAWTADANDVPGPELSDGVFIYTVDFDMSHSLRVSPKLSEPGNYVPFITLPFEWSGINARYRLRNSSGIAKEEFIEYNRNTAFAWFPLGTTPVYFSGDTSSPVSLEILPLDGMVTAMALDAIRWQKQSDFARPAIPELKAVRLNQQGNIVIEWYQTLQGGLAGYRIVQSEDGVAWTDTLANEQTVQPKDTLYVVSVPPGKGRRYFRIIAVSTHSEENENGNPVPLLSEPSDAYGVTYGVASRILIVDAFDRQASWPAPQHAFVRNYGEALWSFNVGWESAANDAIQTGEISLADYTCVIFFCGDDSDRDESLSNIEQMRLWAYLKNGGRLFISGSELGYDLARPGRPDASNYTSILKAVYMTDDSGLRSCTGAPGTAFSGLSFTFGEVTSDTYLEDYPDYIGTAGGSEVVLYYEGTPKVAGISYRGLFDPGAAKEGQLVYFAFPFETIYPAESRPAVIEKVLNYFGVSVSVPATTASGAPTDFFLGQNYPNPFNPETAISYQLSVDSPVKLLVYDLLGRVVATLVDESLPAGRYTVKWNAEQCASGIYLVKLSAGAFSAARKVVLVR